MTGVGYTKLLVVALGLALTDSLVTWWLVRVGCAAEVGLFAGPVTWWGPGVAMLVNATVKIGVVAGLIGIGQVTRTVRLPVWLIGDDQGATVGRVSRLLRRVGWVLIVVYGTVVVYHAGGVVYAWQVGCL